MRDSLSISFLFYHFGRSFVYSVIYFSSSCRSTWDLLIYIRMIQIWMFLWGIFHGLYQMLIFQHIGFMPNIFVSRNIPDLFSYVKFYEMTVQRNKAVKLSNMTDLDDEISLNYCAITFCYSSFFIFQSIVQRVREGNRKSGQKLNM